MRNPIYLFIAIFLSACGYDGPGLGKVMTQTCSSISKFEQYYNCIQRQWFGVVQAQGYGNEGSVQYVMGVGQNLLQGVRSGQLSDADAIYRWQEVQLKMNAQEQAQNARRAQAFQNFGQALQNYGTVAQPSSGGSYTGQSTGTAFFKREYTQGFSKICIYDRLGSVESLTIANTQLCPMTK